MPRYPGYYRNDWPLWIERQIRSAATELWLSSLQDEVRRHVRDGFTRRHFMIQQCRLWLSEHCDEDRKAPLSVYEATEAAIYLNALYLNIRGAFDNLAWSLKYRFDLLPGAEEYSEGRRGKVALFGGYFLDDLRAHRPQAVRRLRALIPWAKEFKERRDPAAHRIPLLVPPGVISDEQVAKEFSRLHAVADRSDAEVHGESRVDLIMRARGLASFSPVMIMYEPDGMKVYRIRGVVGYDLRRYFRAARASLRALQ